MKQSFEEWRKAVDAAVSRATGLSLDDLPDVALRDWYDDGVTPKSAASRAVKYAGGEDE
jgi:hypothetical protein